MTNFEFVFSLFGLLLGLSLAEILGGFAKNLKRHGLKRVGWLAPMLSVFLLYDITTFWLTSWRIRDVVPVGMPSLVVGLCVTGLYYFAAVLAWPDPETSEPHAKPLVRGGFDLWILARKRAILLSVVACNVLGTLASWSLAPSSYHWNSVQLFMLALYFGGMVAVALLPGRRVVFGGLLLLLTLYALDLIVNVTGG
jgi:hypothetical protein